MPKKTTKEETKETTAAAPKENKQKKTSFYQSVGRRKDATARVRLYVVSEGKAVTVNGKEIKAGDIIVNGKPASQFFPGTVSEKIYSEPFRTTNTVGRFAVSVVTSGGGKMGQLLALVHGMSRAIESIEKDKYRTLLKKKGFLRRDPREKQRRKAGFAQKARARKQSPKR